MDVTKPEFKLECECGLCTYAIEWSKGLMKNAVSSD